MPITLEVCIDSVESAIAAQAGDANRVELCGNLMEGGTTPSAGMVTQCLKNVALDVLMMIRPRGGDFLYSDVEFATMVEDIQVAKSCGVYGVVLGVLTAEGKVDKERTGRLLKAARPLKATFHRAFDMTSDPFAALDDLIDLGVDRVLTSGQEASAHQGVPLLKDLVRQAGDRIAIMPGCGINETNIAEIVSKTGVGECHVSGKQKIPSRMTYTNPRVFMGVPGTGEYEQTVVDPKRIRTLRRATEGIR